MQTEVHGLFRDFTRKIDKKKKDNFAQKNLMFIWHESLCCNHTGAELFSSGLRSTQRALSSWSLAFTNLTQTCLHEVVCLIFVGSLAWTDKHPAVWALQASLKCTLFTRYILSSICDKCTVATSKSRCSFSWNILVRTEWWESVFGN